MHQLIARQSKAPGDKGDVRSRIVSAQSEGGGGWVVWSAGTIVSSSYQVRGPTRGQWDDYAGEQRAGLEGWSEAIIGQSKDCDVMEPRWNNG